MTLHIFQSPEMLKLHKGLRAYQKAKIFRVRTGGSPENPIKMFELVPEKPVHHLPGQYIDLKTGIEGCRKLSLSLRGVPWFDLSSFSHTDPSTYIPRFLIRRRKSASHKQSHAG